MKNKIFILIITIFFIISMIILSRVLNNRNKVEIRNEEENRMEILSVTSSNFEKEVINSDKTVLIDFYADWCGPCKMISPVIEAVAKENQDIKVVKVNVDDAQDLAIQYDVMSIPTLVLIKNGQEANRVVGLVDKNEVLNLVK